MAPFLFLNKRIINTNAYGGSGVHVNLAKKVRELVPQVSQVVQVKQLHSPVDTELMVEAG